jgi:GT2 family glycosyltransferase
MSIRRIAVLMTSFNRREPTMRSLAALTRQQRAADFTLQVFLVDDGSTDGTADAVHSAFPEIRVLQGDGSLFWNGGMRMAFAAAVQESFDAYVLLNDDTVLYYGAIARLVACVQTRIETGSPVIAVGSTVSPQTGEHTYGGMVKHVHGPVFRFEKIPPHECLPISCDAMNGNIVLIPREVAEVVGNLEKRFRHQFGDLDYALRARRAGFQVIVAPGYFGECATNSQAGTWRDSTLSLRKRWRNLLSPKGVPVQEWFLFTFRHYGWRAMYYAFSPFLQTVVSSVLSRHGSGATRREPRPAS